MLDRARPGLDGALPPARIIARVLPLVVVAATFVAFIPVLGAEFVNWDDDRNFLQNPYYRGLSSEHVRWMFTTTKMGHYQPLSWLTLGLDYTLWDMKAGGYHLTNLLFHCATALALYVLALRLFAIGVPEGMLRSPRAARLCAAFATLLYGVHPLRAESVAWVTERRDVQSGLFFVLTLIAYLKACAGNRVRPGWYAASIGLMILSLLSKAWAMTIPAVLIVLDVHPLGRVGRSAREWFSAAAMRVWLQKVPFVLLAILTAIKANTAQAGQFETLKSLEEHGVVARIGQAFYGLGFYLYKTLVPIGLAPSYEIPHGFTGLEPANIVSAVLVGVITVALFLMRKRFPAGLAVWVCYVAVVSPVLGIAQAGPQLVKDSYTYLCCMGWGLLLGGGVLRLWAGRGRGKPGAKTGASRPSPERKRGVQDPDVSGGPVARAPGSVALALAVLCVLGTLTWRQASIWKDSETLWAHALAVTPGSYNANNNMGTILRKKGDIEGAVAHYRKAIQAQPDNANTYYNLANALKKLNRYEQAVRNYQAALERNALLCPAHFNLANTLANNLDRPEEALHHYKEALRVKRMPKAPASSTRAQDILYCIAFELNKLGRTDEARDYLTQCLRHDPNHKLANKLKSRIGM